MHDEFYLLSEVAKRSSSSFNSVIVSPPEDIPCLRWSTCEHMHKEVNHATDMWVHTIHEKCKGSQHHQGRK